MIDMMQFSSAHTRKSLKAHLKVLPIALCLSACTVGPDFIPPPPPGTSSYTHQPIEAAPAGGVARDQVAQRFAADRDIPAEWWVLFRSEPLDALIRQALLTSPDLQSAQAAVRVAMENVKAQTGAYYPAIALGLDASRNRDASQVSPVLASNALLYNLYQTQLGVSWAPDLWGGNRRRVEALQALADAQRYQLEATYVTLTASIVAAAIQEASLREQIATTNEIIANQNNVLGILYKQRDLGEIAGTEVAAQEALLAQSRQVLPSLLHQLNQQRNLLTALAGKLPAEGVQQRFSLAALTLPAELPVSLPSKLVAQRADVRVAEENLHAASAEVGVSIADMLPNITLSANAGTIATQIGGLFNAGNGLWSVGAGLTQPIFQGGMLLHRSRAARAAYDQAAAQYRSTVVTAFQNVADALHAVQSNADSERAALAAEAAAARSLAIAENQMRLGQVNRVGLLNAQQMYLQAKLATVQARASRFTDTAALFQALGGGWWKRQDFADSGSEK